MNYKYDRYKKVLTYDELVFRAIDTGENEFLYHDHFYIVQRNEDDGYDVVAVTNGEKVAEVLTNGEEKVVVIEDNKKEYVRNTRSVHYENMYKEELAKLRIKDYPEIPKSEDER